MQIRRSVAATGAVVMLLTLPVAAMATNKTVTKIGARKTQDGTLITAAANRTVYFFRPDEKSTTKHAKHSRCYGACAIVWPPVLATTKPAATGKAKASLIGLTTRKGGAKQVTYNGLPLYYYVPDAKAGQVTGNQKTDRFGFWGALQPNGKLSASG
jgi:predicted lipoprotein with Yx(FWY)xxD motif